MAAVALASVGAALALAWLIGVFSPLEYGNWDAPVLGALARAAGIWLETWFVFAYAVVAGAMVLAVLRRRGVSAIMSAVLTIVAVSVVAGGIAWTTAVLLGSGSIGLFFGLEVGASVAATILPMTVFGSWMARHPKVAAAVVMIAAATLALGLIAAMTTS